MMASNDENEGNKAVEVTLLCPPCYNLVKGECPTARRRYKSLRTLLTRVEKFGEFCAEEYPEVTQDEISEAFEHTDPHFELIYNPSKCQSPKCLFWQMVQETSKGTKKRWNPNRCLGGPRQDPDICTCEDPHFKEEHEKILSCINRMERSFQELHVAEGVTLELSKQVRVSKQIDPSELHGPTRGRVQDLMEKVADLSMDVKVNNTQ